MHLGRDHKLLAGEKRRQDIAGYDLALAAVVDISGVEKRDPTLHRAADDRLRIRL
jgi:hypothetical protein